VGKFLILPKEFSVTGGELGPSLKLKRYFVAEMYANDIDRMYQD
jgi:long-chain-fatty-acid--CoA ligase ACSBG